MALPTQIAIIDVAHHDGTAPDSGSYTARFLDIGTAAGGVHTLAGVDVAAGALVVPVIPTSAVITEPSLSVETIGEEPVITTSGSGDVSISIGSGSYAGTYTMRHDGAPLTTTMIEAAPTCLALPVISGPATVGSTLTIMPGLWVYAGGDPGDQTWVQKVDGVETGENDLNYTVQPADAGRDFTVEEIFGTVSVTSIATSLSA